MRQFLLSLCLLLAATGAQSAEPLANLHVVLLQPSKLMEARVADIDAMAAYVKAVEAAARDAVTGSSARQSTSGFIVVAVRPGLQSNVWLDFDAMLDLDLKKQVVGKVKAIAPFEVSQGPVVFALKVSLWGGKESKRTAPVPPEWKSATRGEAPVEIGELVERLWAE